MIAIVTSTLQPSENDISNKSFYTFIERLEQTKHTLNNLIQLNFDTIFLIDNSTNLPLSEVQNLLIEFKQVKIFQVQQYQFKNKGINEILMLLYLLQFLPANQNIFKISGRYYPTTSFEKPYFSDFAAKGYCYKKRTGTISTRAYWVKDKNVFYSCLSNCLNEVFTYPERITGFRSLYNKLASVILKKHTEPLNISIEFAFANVLKKSNYKLKLLDCIGIEGLVAGAGKVEKIIE